MGNHLSCLLVKSLNSSRSSASVLSLIGAISELFDYEYYGFCIQAPIPISRHIFEAFSYNNKTGQQRHSTQASKILGPTSRNVLEVWRPIIWNGDMDWQAPLFPDEFQSLGLKYGWALSTRDQNGSISLICFARRDKPITTEEREHRCAEFTLTAQLIHNAMLKTWLPEKIPEASLSITPREKEVLRWAAEGKTSHETATIMSISERTVNFHINNSVEKLGATNRVQAVVKAAMLGKLSGTPPLDPMACTHDACASCGSSATTTVPIEDLHRARSA